MEKPKVLIQNLSDKEEEMMIIQQRQSLPMYMHKKEVIDLVTNNQISIIIGETGSGKSTQVTQFLAESNFGSHGKICCTQPRTIAAISLADRVAKEFGCPLGKEVGYTVRFDDFTCKETIIQYMTDGVLLRKCMTDPDLQEYSVILLDEAHERTVHTDILFALLKHVVCRRPNFKLVVTSATLDAETISNYFFNAPILNVAGRTFPVEILYSKDPEKNYLRATLNKIMEIHTKSAPGDILVFLPGENEINRICKNLKKRVAFLKLDEKELFILPMYSSLPTKVKERVFEKTPSGSRKIVLATNIAETSITIDGIFYVIDPGFMKHMMYDSKLDLSSLSLTRISQAQAKQRSGRAGRTGPGKCYRLYSEHDFTKNMLQSPVPVIKCCNIISEILQLKVIGFDDILAFDFMDAPPEGRITAALEELQSLSALDENKKLTPLGKLMAKFPLKPNLAKTIIDSIALGCSDEIVTIASLLSVGSSIYFKSRSKEESEICCNPQSDPLTYLEIFNAWEENDFSFDWCVRNNIKIDNLQQGEKVRSQLLRIMERCQLPIVSCNGDTDRVGEAICSGFFKNVARKDATGRYITAREKQIVHIHPSSVLIKGMPDCIVYNSLFKTSRKFMCGLMACNEEWLYSTEDSDTSADVDIIQDKGKTGQDVTENILSQVINLTKTKLKVDI